MSLRVGSDRMLLPAWRTSYLLEQAEKQYRKKYNIRNIDEVVTRPGALGRVMDEYFKREKVTAVSFNVSCKIRIKQYDN